MSIIDFHSHILPGIDDGSKNIETSIEMLKESMSQKVDVMVATPHFYAETDTIEGFIKKRKQAYESIVPVLPAGAPRILLGAEVAFFRGISDAKKINNLVIQNSDILLLEMPFSPWTSSEVEEVIKMVGERKFRIMLAHVERFMKIPHNKPYIKELLRLPVIVQINAESLTDWRQRGKILKLFGSDKDCVLGSDCHGIHHRPPNLSVGRAVLNRKIGQNAVCRMDEFGMNLLS